MLAAVVATSATITGAFTFLFTDLEASTRTWEHDPEGMDRWLAAHDRILTEAISAHRGRVFKHTGDGMCAVFTTSADALAAARAVQMAMAAAGDAVGPLQVRIAVHAGEARERAGDYYGPTLNRCARLLDIAHGGQVLLSAAAAVLLRGAVGDGLTLIDLGQHRLRDLQQPEHVWQLVGAGLRHDFPPLRSLDAFTHNLPLQRSSFVGRENEMSVLADLLATQRLVTITGVGGCGKTRLALEVAARRLDRFADGVCFVDLAAQTEPALVTATIVAALHMPAGPGDAPSRLVEFLKDRQCLFVFDNCEHLLDASAATAHHLLSTCAKLTILTTSREPLGLDGEHVWRVPSLALPTGDALEQVAQAEAVRLFVDRAAAVRPGFVLTAENAAAVAAICRRLDGIPLAVELAAARIAHLTPAEVAARLSDRFRLLTGGRRGVQRQQTLQAVLDWSHDLLSEPERTLLRRLAVFAGGWRLDDAQAVCAGPDLDAATIIDLLGALVSRSLVDAEDRGDHTRYRLLETVRLYAQDRLLAAGEADAVRGTHADWFLRRVETEGYGGPWFPPRVSPTLAVELDNLRQAADWWRERGRLDRMARIAAPTINEFHLQARFDEPEEWLHAALADGNVLPPELRAQCLAALGIAAEMRGDFVSANQHASTAIATVERPADAGGAYSLLVGNLIWVDPDEAERLLEHAEEWTLPLGAFAADFVCSTRAVLACARRDYERAVALFSGVHDARYLRGPSGGTAVTAHLLRGDVAAAAKILDESYPRWVSTGWPAYYLSLFRALLAALRGDPTTARAYLIDAVAIIRRWKVPLGAADGVLACAALAFHAGRVERASELLASIHAATGGLLRSPMSMCLYRHYVSAVRAALDRDAVTRARAAGAALSLDAALARGLEEV
jgi:predicted ATPase/class 3 adenylate cyclase